MKGLFSDSLSNFHSAPSRFEISELCILGFSWAIFLRCPLDQTMNAFMGRLMCSWFWWMGFGEDIAVFTRIWFFFSITHGHIFSVNTRWLLHRVVIEVYWRHAVIWKHFPELVDFRRVEGLYQRGVICAELYKFKTPIPPQMKDNAEGGHNTRLLGIWAIKKKLSGTDIKIFLWRVL